MCNALLGLHHVTAIVGEPQRNVDFYEGLLGLRLIKKTVNFDDPSTYHLYFGNGDGSPGTILTFFPWPGAQRGRRGSGQATAIALRVPDDSLRFWRARLHAYGVAFTETAPRFGEPVLSFTDHDGLQIELIAGADGGDGWGGGTVAAEQAVRRMHSVTLTEAGYENTADLLTETMGFHAVGEEGGRFRYAAKDGSAGALVDVICLPEAPRGHIAVGTVHHVAWRAADDAAQAQWHETLARQNHNVSPIMDRTYFHSIYFREPGGVLFEIATDPPGFAIDEPAAELGTHLMLPPWLEPRRADLEQTLTPIHLPEGR